MKIKPLADEQAKAPNLFIREKAPKHHKETHGSRKDIDDNTPLDDVRAPNVFERAKEEFEALIQTIHPKKDSPPHGTRSCTRAALMI